MTLYQKILSVVGTLRASIGLKASRTELANAFDPSVEYQEGRLVVYEGRLYRCVGGHYGAWNDNDFVLSTVDAAIRADSGSADIPVPSDDTPLVDDGNGDSGESETYSRSDHVHPTDATRQSLIKASGILKGDGEGGVTAAGAGTDYTAPASIASEFSTSTSYAENSLVWYDGSLYRCTSAHSGAWDGSHFEPSTVNAAIEAGGGGFSPSANPNYAIEVASINNRTVQLHNRTVHRLILNGVSVALILPSPEADRTADLLVDVIGAGRTQLSISGTQGETYLLVVPMGENWDDMRIVENGEVARYYFTLTGLYSNGVPAWLVMKRILSWVS